MVGLGSARDFFRTQRSAQSGCLSHEQHLRLEGDGRPCPRIKYHGRSSESVYADFSWVCGGENEDGKDTFSAGFVWSWEIYQGYVTLC